MSTPISRRELKDKLSEKGPVCLLDVRRKADHDKSPTTIAGATWYDPEKVEEWSKTLPKDRELVVYCVKGGAVSQSIADSLQKSHPGVKFLEGGMVGWTEGKNKKRRDSNP